jgi:S-methylmethionine-dependent homocysteine/selenocysteine methylase
VAVPDGGAVTILDGGMSRELMRLGAPFRQPEWSALALIESPEHVRRAYDEFARAGASVLTTNAYAVVPFHVGEERFAAEGDRLAALAASICREVADDYGAHVAGCLPPVLGSYRPGAFDAEVARPILEVLVEAQARFVDLWLVETTSSLDEAELAVSVVTASGSSAPLWVAFTLDDGGGARLRSGEPVSAAVSVAVAAGASAVLFNCSQPEVMSEAVEIAVTSTDLPVGVYANVLDEHGADGPNELVHEVRLDASAEGYAVWAEEWVAAGATIVGGCCGTDARHVSALSARLSAG